jgi:hypothetical protein
MPRGKKVSASGLGRSHHTYVVVVLKKILVTMSICPGACFTPQEKDAVEKSGLWCFA